MSRTDKFTDKFPTKEVLKQRTGHPNYWLRCGCPRWYCNMYERKHRTHNREELYRVLMNWTEEDNFLYWHKHNATYDYW